MDSRRHGLLNQALAKSLREGEERFVDLSPATMSLLDRLVLKHNFDTDHLFVVLKKDARDKTGRSTYGQPLNRHTLIFAANAYHSIFAYRRAP